MTVYRIVAVGHFRGPDGGPKLIEFPGFDGVTIAGFYTTRVVEAPVPQRAMELAADSIFDELSDSLNKEDNIYELEIESCEEVTYRELKSPPRGFSFYSDE